MKHNAQHLTLTLTFVLLLGLSSVLCILRGANPVSYSKVEKRPLATFPADVTPEEIRDGRAADRFDAFATDQFPFREFFRAVKARFTLYALGLKQNNGYAIENGSIAQIEKEFNRENVDHSLSRLSYLYNRYLTDTDSQVYLALIPDKNYFFAKDYSYPSPDYDALKSRLHKTLPNATYIELFDTLSLADYYKTDWHWDQSRLDDTLARLGQAMQFADRLPSDYTQKTLSPFRGGYHDQSALYPPPEALTYRTNDVIDSLTLYDYATGTTSGVYLPKKFDSDTPYDFFMDGLQGLQRIDNPSAATEDELIVFRDSFGSSILPLIAQAYRTVYVVDIRTVSPATLGSVIDVSGKDVLLLYSTTVLNTKTFK